jgi:hypothetical protein
MPRLRAIRRLLAASGATCAVALAGCGSGEGLLPADQAAELDAALGRVSEATAGGDCDRALRELGSAQTIYARLPRATDAALLGRIRDGLAQLARTVPNQCGEAEDQTTPEPGTTQTDATTDEPATTTGATTTTTTTRPTTTTRTTTTTTAPTTTTPTDPGTGTGTATSPNGGVAPGQPTAPEEGDG